MRIFYYNVLVLSLLLGSWFVLKKTTEDFNLSSKLQFELGEFYYDGKIGASNYYKSRYWHEKAAAQGIAKAKYRLGTMYEDGYSVRRNIDMAMDMYKEAASQYRKDAAKGSVSALIILGRMYMDGEGVSQDVDTALKLFGEACDKGSQKGCDVYKSVATVKKNMDQGAFVNLTAFGNTRYHIFNDN